MPRRKKKAIERTTNEAMRKMFPKKIRDEAKKTALEKGTASTKRQST